MPVMTKKSDPWSTRLKQLRDHYGMTQESAAAAIDTPVNTWRNWEQGRRHVSPTIVKLLQLAFPEYFSK